MGASFTTAPRASCASIPSASTRPTCCASAATPPSCWRSPSEGPRRAAGGSARGAVRPDRAGLCASWAGDLHRRAARPDAGARARRRAGVDRRADASDCGDARGEGAHARVRVRSRTRDRGLLLRLRRAGARRGGRLGGDRLRPAGGAAPAQGLVLPGGGVKDRFDVVVVGSGAGGGVVAGELAERGRDVLLLEAGPHLTAVDFDRWEAKATHELWWPIRFGLLPDGDVVAFLAGRCVGGTTTINTKVALRAHEKDVAKWHGESGLTADDSRPFAVSDLEPYYARVEERLGIRERADWQPCVHTIERGMKALGHELEPVMSYTDGNCMHCGSCLQGCPTNAGKSTGNTWIADSWARGLLELRADSPVERVVIEGGRATGVEVGGETIRADTVVVAGGALNTPQILRRSGLDSPTIGKYLGLHPVRVAYGLFDE